MIIIKRIQKLLDSWLLAQFLPDEIDYTDNREFYFF